MGDIQTVTPKLSVTFLDDFKLTCKDSSLNEKKIKSDMVTKLLAYIICHRKNNLSVQELSEALWEDDECDNPANALKNLIYRLRSALKKNIGDYLFIMTGRGYYFWNGEVSVEVDAEVFEDLCKRASNEKNINKRIEYARLAVKCYKEKFLSQYTDKYWVVTLNAYYHSMYLDIVRQLSIDLLELKKYDEMEKICYMALSLDEFDEDIHYYYMKALISENKRNMAVKHFFEVKKMLYDKLSVNPSKKLCEIYNELLKTDMAYKADITNISNELRKYYNVADGAYLCEYEIFKKSCEIELRKAKRSDIGIYIILFTIESGLKNSYSGKNNSVTTDSIEKVTEVIKHSLRSGDIISRYSIMQFVVLIQSFNYEDVSKIAKRILQNTDNLKANVRLNYSIEKLNK